MLAWKNSKSKWLKREKYSCRCLKWGEEMKQKKEFARECVLGEANIVGCL